ncbi:hypothetical protein GIB67_002216 [Kingdonia uniflora]|uniref:Uncharacterized protein n=1 Tax=Kingdonia uniflora TaxID=39325 RepID=A0A7J7KWQ2_9MAGN|nr:hypothetical protein GIB67_002216 [Kingdonia uniflora]
MTIDRLEANLSKAFGHGMVYVVLSQVKSLNELHLIGFNLLKIKAHPKVMEFYNSHFLNENFARPKRFKKRSVRELEIKPFIFFSSTSIISSNEGGAQRGNLDFLHVMEQRGVRADCNTYIWWYAKRFLHPDVVAAYEYIFIWDEDLGVEHFNADK